jgi:hypothetical protein
VFNAVTFIEQALLLVAALVLVSRPLFMILAAAALVSGLVNAIYTRILHQNIDLAGMTWMLAEHRQSGPAFIEFFWSIAAAGAKTVVAIALLVLARRLIDAAGADHALRRVRRSTVLGVVVLAAFVAAHGLIPQVTRLQAAEVNVFPLFVKASLQTYPAHRPVEAQPSSAPQVAKIIWLVDESVASHWFHVLFQPGLTSRFGAIDYGDAESFGNCSAQSNSALRWGVDVGTIGPTTDLRTTPTIWAYAHAAGYRTSLFDGQVRGAVQDNIWPPERALIEHYYPSRNGITTDRQMAEKLNQIIKRKGRDFVYVVLRGSHYQYYGNYPKGELPASSPLIDQYMASIKYSKRGFFETLLAGVNRDNVAIFYTSDHGQVIKPGVVPHCNERPHAEEYAVPLLLFAPPRLHTTFAKDPASHWRNSHSQIFPTTLVLMGYDKTFSESHYDHPLPGPPERMITFGKRIVPNEDEPTIQLNVNRRYPPFPG